MTNLDNEHGIPTIMILNGGNQVEDEIDVVVKLWEEACNTVCRLSHLTQLAWPGAVVRLHHYGEGVRLKWRSDEDKQMFKSVILGAWERATGRTVTITVPL